MRKRCVLVRFCLDEKEAAHFNRLIQRSGLTRSTYLRQLISGVIPADHPPPDYFLMMRELHSIGNNLNQIARHAHAIGVVDEGRYDKNIARLDKTIKNITEAVILPRRYG
ncbi:MAG: MobC family plasmid mobilization relaxosome protein [Coriobacteriales bacterium]|nr:MobC family plasmid mobilization relaxosome protein [Coriobacteriales bacterium]